MNKYYPVKKKFYVIITDMFVFIFGTTRSGKSVYAERRLLDMDGHIKLYVATARICDEEMHSRVELHQLRRQNLGVSTIERPEDLGELSVPEGVCVLVEGLSTWTANEMFGEDRTVKGAEEVRLKVYGDFRELRQKVRNIIVVADDIFSDGTDYDVLTEAYRKTLAELEIMLVDDADEVIECCAGIPLSYKTSCNIL